MGRGAPEVRTLFRWLAQETTDNPNSRVITVMMCSSQAIVNQIYLNSEGGWRPEQQLLA